MMDHWLAFYIIFPNEDHHDSYHARAAHIDMRPPEFLLGINLTISHQTLGIPCRRAQAARMVNKRLVNHVAKAKCVAIIVCLSVIVAIAAT
jgi:hypothetical protein